MKRILTSCLVVLICLTAFLTGYGKGCYSYATNQDGTLTNDELDVALSSWLQSHGGNIWSPQNYRARKTYEAGLLHNFIYDTAGGYDAIRSHINGGVGGNNELKFDFDGLIIQQLNTWLNNKLQNGEFGQGVTMGNDGMLDAENQNTLYDGKGYDNQLCYIYNNSVSSASGSLFLPQVKGSTYVSSQSIIANYDSSTNKSNVTLLDGTTLALTCNYTSNIYKRDKYNTYSNFLSSNVTGKNGFGAYVLTNNGTKLWFATIFTTSNGDLHWFTEKAIASNSTDVNALVVPLTVNFNTSNNLNITDYPDVDADGHLYITPKVNVGIDGEVNYQPYIINEGDTISNVINNYYYDSNTPDKTVSYPSDDEDDTGGGNGGNPSGGTPPNWNNPFPNLSPDGEGGFNFNFTLPDLNIDWNINGLTEKFPFSIPFDLIHFVQVLNAEPETPEFDWTIDLKIYQWHIDADLHQFDNLAGIVRNVEFIGFCITLVMITRRMIKG